MTETLSVLQFQQLTEDRRKELVKLVKKEAEEAKIAIRNIRRDANDDLKKLEKSSDILKMSCAAMVEEIQKLTDSKIVKNR